VSDEFRGYDPSKERVDLLLADSQVYHPVCGYSGADLPDPKEIIRLDLQNSWPACGGFMGSTMGEWMWFLRTGERIQLSPMFCWVEAQRTDGRPSQSSGVSIYGVMKVLKELGLPEEDLAPYKVGNWYSTFGKEVYENAKQHTFDRSYRLDTPEKVVDFVKAGMGAVGCGIPWEGGMRSWHALPILAPWEDGVQGPNSWPKSVDKYGEKDGWFEWSFKKLEWYMEFSGSVFYGVSELTTPQIRPGWDKKRGGFA